MESQKRYRLVVNFFPPKPGAPQPPARVVDYPPGATFGVACDGAEVETERELGNGRRGVGVLACTIQSENTRVYTVGTFPFGELNDGESFPPLRLW